MGGLSLILVGNNMCRRIDLGYDAFIKETYGITLPEREELDLGTEHTVTIV